MNKSETLQNRPGHIIRNEFIKTFYPEALKNLRSKFPGKWSFAVEGFSDAFKEILIKDIENFIGPSKDANINNEDSEILDKVRAGEKISNYRSNKEEDYKGIVIRICQTMGLRPEETDRALGLIFEDPNLDL